MSTGRPIYPRPTPEERAERVAQAKRAVALSNARARARAGVAAARDEVDADLERRGIPRFREWRMDLDGPTWTVDLFESARTVIGAEAWASDDGTETGGWLLGYQSPMIWDVRAKSVQPGTVMIADATGPGPKAERDFGSVLLDYEYGERQARARGFAVVGAWHSHTTTDATSLSEPDLRSMARHLDRMPGAESFTEIIVSPVAGWSNPDWTPYVMTPDQEGKGGPPVVQRGRLR